MTSHHAVAVIGAGPAGLSATLNLVRARRSTLLLDGNRPRNAATFHSHGFITRDGVSPLTLRKLARDELDGYPEYTYSQTAVKQIARTDEGFAITTKSGLTSHRYTARIVVVATGVTETMPPLKTIRAFYGTSIHSCIECDGYEEADKQIALIGETGDLADRAVLLSQWSDDIIVFTNAADVVSADEEAMLASRGIRVDRRQLDDVEGDQTGLTGIRTASGDVVPRQAAFVRPVYTPGLEWSKGLDLRTVEGGFLDVDAHGRTSAPGIYAAGDATIQGPRQLIISAGEGAKVAATVNTDLVRGLVD